VVLEEAGSSLENVVKVNIFITKMDDFAAMNEGYDQFFSKDPKPVCIVRWPGRLPIYLDDLKFYNPYLQPPSAELVLQFISCLS
jgi:2-iminobutanoate/2-iminopropanoate deaminase